MSINKAQAEALAEGFLDHLGTTSTGLQPRETFTEIILLAGEFIEAAQTNLNADNSNASGVLSASLVANEPVMVAGVLQIDVMMSFYGKFVNKGVKGTKSGSSTAGYSFKYDMPGKTMLDAIQEWQRAAKASTSNVNAKRSTSRNEIKNASIAAIDSAFAIARSIKQKGIKPTGFLDRAVLTTQDKVRDRLGTALQVDIINSLNNP